MHFKFLHAADIHLDSPLRGLPLRGDERAEAFRSASRKAFVNLVDAALREKVAFLVIAGDLFDGDWKDLSTGLFFAEQMGKLARAGIRVFIVHGNHDAETAMSKRLPWPDNVHIFSSRRAETHLLDDLKVAIHGQSFAKPDTVENIALDYPAPKPGWLNIGVLHTACDGREGHAPYAPCTLDQLILHGYDYWALGHVHRREVLNRHPYVVFPGNLQGRHIKEMGSKGATLVAVSEGEIDEPQHLDLDAARWSHITIDVTGLDTKNDALKAMEEQLKDEVQASPDLPLAVRVEFVGNTMAHSQLTAEGPALRDEVESLTLGMGDMIWIEKVKISTSHPATETLAMRSDVLGQLVLLLPQVAGDPEIQARLADEIRHLMTRLPRSKFDAESLPSEDTVDDLLEEACQLVSSKLQTSAGAL